MRAYHSRGTGLCRELSKIALVIGLAAGASTAAMAQEETDADQTPTSTAPTGDDPVILVTGSRVTRSTFETPNPVTVLTSEDIEKLNLNNVAEVLQQLPQNSNFFAPNNIGLGNFNVGAQLANLRGLNPFFGTRTLTLVDTRRVVPTTTGGGVDITLIPSMLVGRTETVTGGASAVYGSDAVAGVVNIILDTELEGLKAQADFSRTTHGDGDDWHAAAAYGTGFAEGRGHIVVGGEYQNSDSIGVCAEERDWCGKSYGLFTNPDYATNGQPHYIIGPDATETYTSLTGVLLPCAFPFFGLCNVVGGTRPAMQFNPDGTALIPYDYGNYSDGGFNIFGSPRQGGDQYAVGAYEGSNIMRPSVERWNTLAHVKYELTPAINAFVEGSYAHSAAANPRALGAIGPSIIPGGPSFIPGFSLYFGSQIAPDNAFLPPAVAAAIPGGALLGRSFNNILNANNDTTNKTWRLLGGLDGDLGGGLSWDAYFSHGENKNTQHLFHTAVTPLLQFTLDPVDNGAGNIVCGVTIPGRTNPNTGAPYSAADVALATASGTCVPLNPFGTSNFDQGALDYAFHTLSEYSTTKQDVAAVNLRGDLFDGWGTGPVKFATGVEWRHESGLVTHDVDLQPWYNFYTIAYGLDYGGTTEVLEGYAEVNVPVFRDAPIGRYLELDGAIRGTRNKNEGTLGAGARQTATHEFIAWKVSGIWDVTDWLRVRGTRSRDVRAGQFRELFQTFAPTDGGIFSTFSNPWAGGVSDEVLSTSGGNVDLKPERADTLTVGAVLSPQGFLSGFRFSADWYQIKIADAIVGPPFGIGGANIITGCFSGNQTFCDLMTGEGTADILTIRNLAANLQGFTVRGVDFEAAYNLPVGHDGSLNFRVLASYLYDQLFQTGRVDTQGDPLPVSNYAGQSGPTAAFGSFNSAPKWQGNAFVTFSQGPFTATVQARYVGSGRFLTVTGSGGAPIDPSDPDYDTTNPNSISDNSVNDAIYINLSASFDVTDEVQVFGSLNNAFDKDPAIAPGGNGYPTNPVYFDTFGRTFRVGARVKL